METVEVNGADLVTEVTYDDTKTDAEKMLSALNSEGYEVTAVIYPNAPPIAQAGNDQEVPEGDTVTLDGSGSYDPDGDPISYQWEQIVGTRVSLSAFREQPTFGAPDVSPEGESLTFRLTVSDGAGAQSADTCIIHVTHLEASATHTDITPQAAKEMIDTHPDLIIIDVREPEEFCGSYGHIPGSVNYPWNSGVLEEKYAELPTDADILVVCRSGNRSDQAANFLDSKRFTAIYDAGGMNAWEWDTLNCSDQPPVLSFTMDTEQNVFLSWTAYSGSYFESYTLLRDTLPDPEYSQDGYLWQGTDAMVTAYTDDIPLPGTSYYRVCVGKTQGEALCSESVRVVQKDDLPDTGKRHHRADFNPRDNKINLSELLRVIQIYNNGSYYCGDPDVEDGYELKTGTTETCEPHDSDYAPQDWRISLNEMLRMIQFYNAGGYSADLGGEDGFSP